MTAGAHPLAKQGHPQDSPPILAFRHVQRSYSTALASGTLGMYSTLENGQHQRMSPFSSRLYPGILGQLRLGDPQSLISTHMTSSLFLGKEPHVQCK